MFGEVCLSSSDPLENKHFSGIFFQQLSYQGKTWLKRKGQTKSRVAKNRHRHISAAAPANNSSECQKRWRNDFDDEVRRAI